MAQSTPTHASGINLVTVAMTVHAEDKGSTTTAHSSLKRCCLNAVNESRSESVGLYRNEQGGLLAWYINRGGTASQTGTLEHSPEQDLSRRNGVDNQNTSICNNMMHDHGM